MNGIVNQQFSPNTSAHLDAAPLALEATVPIGLSEHGRVDVDGLPLPEGSLALDHVVRVGRFGHASL